MLAASSVLRSLFGAAFPLFTTQMYDALGIHWASSIPAFLALACMPFPFLFYKYGESIRLRCKFAAEAAAVLEKLRGAAADDAAAAQRPSGSDGGEKKEKERDGDSDSVEQGSIFVGRPS